MSNQLSGALVRLREMILRGELAPGQRITEERIAELLGLSRTPVRQALPLLACEGLLIEQETRGYVVRAFTASDVLDAIDVRAVLEGLAVRRVAEQGASKTLIRDLNACLDEGDRILRRRSVKEEDEVLYAEMNERFHALILDAAASEVICDALKRNNSIPFAGPKALAFDKTDLEQEYELLHYAHRQHHEIVDALERGQGSRAEALMREHAHAVKSSINMANFVMASPRMTLVR